MPKRIFEGIVVQNKNDKTVKVRVEEHVMHAAYRKYVKRHKQFSAHDEKNECQIGAKVEITEHRPISKTKKWIVSKIIENGGAK